uniref:Uncharacterized protein n=1 Tax=candidate division CPR3 bacterium TaxID=2268181 RepID=A0A7C5YXM2_UNCC3
MIKTKLIKEKIKVWEGDYQLFVELENNRVSLLNERGRRDFIFDCGFDRETIKRWKKVVALLNKTVKMLEERLNVKK